MLVTMEQELLSNLQNYQTTSNSLLKHQHDNSKQVCHSPSNSDTSSLFSTVDCSSFSSRSDASSFVKEEVVTSLPPTSSVSVSLEFTSSSSSESRLVVEQSDVNKTDGAYLEFSFLQGKLLEKKNNTDNKKLIQQQVTGTTGTTGASTGETSQADDTFETFPVWTDRTRYFSKEIHTCMNPCFDHQTRGDGGASDVGTPRNSSRKKKLAKSLGSVLARHLVLSPGPTFRRSSYEKFFRSRLAGGLDHHPSSEHSTSAALPPPLTPSRTFNGRVESGYSSSPSPVCVTKHGNSPRISFKSKLKPAGELFVCTSGKNYLYGTSPRRGFESTKSLGCLRGISTSEEEELPPDHDNGLLYVASSSSEETVHGGKGRCLPSPRLSFGLGKGGSSSVSKQEESTTTTAATRTVATMSMRVPGGGVRGHIHCMVKNELPCFTFLAEGLDEVLVARGARASSPDGLDSSLGGGEVIVYNFYAWKPKGRARGAGNWRSWVRRDKSLPDIVARMVVTSRAIPAESKDGNVNDEMELEFVLSSGGGTTTTTTTGGGTSCSPRLSFSTWETGSSPLSTACKTPSPAYYNFPSPYNPVPSVPSPGRLTYATSSRYVSMSMLPSSLTSPRLPQVPRRSSKAGQSTASPLRFTRSDDEKSCCNDAWSDTEVAEASDQSELAAVVVRVDGGLAHSSWGAPRLSQRSGSGRKSCTYYRRFSLPGRVQTVAEAKENQEENRYSHRRTPSMKLRELMGVRSDFGTEGGVDCTENVEGRSRVTVVLPAGHHGIPIPGTGGPQPLVERWRAGGRCDCGSWDLGCGLMVLEGLDARACQESLLKICQQGKAGSSTLELGAQVEGLFPVSFEAPFSYLQAFGSCVAALYCRGARVLECESRRSSVSKPPRIPLKPLSSQRRIAALAGYCSPPRVDRL